jgi:ATP synthase protein I
MKNTSNIVAKVGSWAFIIGTVLALAVGLLSSKLGYGLSNPIVASILIIAGTIVGFLNVTGTETRDFLFSSLVLVIILKYTGDAISTVLTIGPYLDVTLKSMIIFIAPAAVVVALKAIYLIGKDA